MKKPHITYIWFCDLWQCSLPGFAAGFGSTPFISFNNFIKLNEMSK